ncbi:N,N-dimethylformamidase beta subunit family domain-containing protein [Arthrobacter sp. NPDC058192]|uniref:N,N-dimethylformamidase beta subunit family domain-containing protein n=1 Tax=Arthrobacter sp. NPDC058192 TaxID=3346372 RepID=UPI0036EBA1E5
MMGASGYRPERRAVIRGVLAGLAWVAAEAALGEPAPRHPVNPTSGAIDCTARAGTARFAPSPARLSGAGFSAAGENRLPGTPRADVASNWLVTPTLEGFLGQHASTPRRRHVDVYVNSTLHSIRIKAYRIGHYNGEGQRLVWTSGPVPVRRQPPFTLQRGTRMVSCPWRVTTSIDTSGWPEGLYYLVLTGGSGRDHMIPLVVESASVVGKAELVFNDCTMQAYNKWGGYSLYTGPQRGPSDRSYKVSFDRPYLNFDEIDRRNAPLIRAAEAIADTGLTLAYTTEARISGNPRLVSGAAAVIFSAHSEYWSPALRRTVEDARDTGTNVVFFGANNVYWRTRLEASPTGEDRVMVCYREARLDPYGLGHSGAATTRWRQGPAPEPESTLTGSVYGDLDVTGMFTVTEPDFFAFAGTGAARGATYAGLTAGEVDRLYPPLQRPGFAHAGNLLVFAHSPAAGRHAPHGWSDSTFYTAASGAGVLDMGTTGWLPAQTDEAVPARSRDFANRVTQNIIRAAAAGPLGRCSTGSTAAGDARGHRA